jgi:hypothetical protein
MQAYVDMGYIQRSKLSKKSIAKAQELKMPEAAHFDYWVSGIHVCTSVSIDGSTMCRSGQDCLGEGVEVGSRGIKCEVAELTRVKSLSLVHLTCLVNMFWGRH